MGNVMGSDKDDISIEVYQCCTILYQKPNHFALMPLESSNKMKMDGVSLTLISKTRHKEQVSWQTKPAQRKTSVP